MKSIVISASRVRVEYLDGSHIDIECADPRGLAMWLLDDRKV